MRRFLGAVLVGLGTLLIVLAVGMPTFLEPQVSQLPTNLKACNSNISIRLMKVFSSLAHIRF